MEGESGIEAIEGYGRGTNELDESTESSLNCHTHWKYSIFK